MTFCDTTAGIGASVWTDAWIHGETEGQTDMEVEIVNQIKLE